MAVHSPKAESISIITLSPSNSRHRVIPPENQKILVLGRDRGFFLMKCESKFSIKIFVFLVYYLTDEIRITIAAQACMLIMEVQFRSGHNVVYHEFAHTQRTPCF